MLFSTAVLNSRLQQQSSTAVLNSRLQSSQFLLASFLTDKEYFLCFEWKHPTLLGGEKIVEKHFFIFFVCKILTFQLLDLNLLWFLSESEIFVNLYCPGICGISRGTHSWTIFFYFAKYAAAEGSPVSQFLYIEKMIVVLICIEPII